MFTGIPLMFLIAVGVVIIVMTLYRATRRSDAGQKDIYSDYLEAERAANFSRRSDLAPEDYLTVSTDMLPIREYPNDPAYERAAARQKNVLEAARLPMVRDAQSMSNRELKLKYGTANLDTIIIFEENYNRFIHNLLEWATALITVGEKADAAAVLAAAVEHHCDRSQAYTLMADLTADRGGLYSLREKAKNALSGAALERTLAHIDTRIGAL
ncbi:MAG: hypothetical protein FWE68_05220 [Defluviitaleaceae bacterium]|nr:hypothetical protein [Defluviitaleaceae bacterium]